MSETVFGDNINNSSPVDSGNREALREFRDDLYDKYGIYFPDKKFYKLNAKVGKRLRELGLDSIEEYDRYLRENPGEVSDFLDVISTNTTRFYREIRHWKFVEEELLNKWKNQRKVVCWSAACSSGEEPYTLAAFLEESRQTGDFEYNILATDLSENVLRRGLKGIYPSDSLEPFQQARPDLANKYFQSTGRGMVRVDDEIQERTVFRRFNLKSDKYPYRNKFDLVFIRNVLIYFDNNMIEHVIDNLAKSMKRGGYLFTGHSETLNKIDHDLEKIQPSIFRK